MLEYFVKTSREGLDYTVDFRRWLEDHENIVNCSAIITPDTAAITRVAFTNREVVVWLMGGEILQQYIIAVTAMTNQGRTKEEFFLVKVIADGGGEYVTGKASISDAFVTIGPIGPLQANICDAAVTVNLVAGGVPDSVGIADTTVLVNFISGA